MLAIAAAAAAAAARSPAPIPLCKGGLVAVGRSLTMAAGRVVNASRESGTSEGEVRDRGDDDGDDNDLLW